MPEVPGITEYLGYSLSEIPALASMVMSTHTEYFGYPGHRLPNILSIPRYPGDALSKTLGELEYQAY